MKDQGPGMDDVGKNAEVEAVWTSAHHHRGFLLPKAKQEHLHPHRRHRTPVVHLEPIAVDSVSGDEM